MYTCEGARRSAGGWDEAAEAELYAAVHDVRLSYERRGSGLPVVLLHGLGDSRDLWRHQLQPLGRRFDVVAVDLRGHGQSAAAKGPFTLDDMAHDVRALIAALRLERPVLVGLSMGGGVAQTLAVREPSLVRGLVLVSTSSSLPEATRLRMRSRADRAERDGMAAVIDETVPRWFTAEFAQRNPGEVARTSNTVLRTPAAAFAAASRANAERELTGMLSRLECPVLFVGGLDDPAEPRRAADVYWRHVRDLRVELLPNASHLVPVETPERFNPLLLRFLAELEPTRVSQGGNE